MFPCLVTSERMKRFQNAESLGQPYTEFVHFRPGRALCNSQRMAKMTRIGSYFAMVACLTDIAKLFLYDGNTL